ncbi:hypothetical protein KUCAC02_036628 [Chaenocephalus aceratus]|nr:hypothetical protein KUCAC02_036628 [Chaenocephalus aceratus]
MLKTRDIGLELRKKTVEALFARRFQRDHDPKHASNLVHQLLKDTNSTVLEGPAQSPDLNPVEDLEGAQSECPCSEATQCGLAGAIWKNGPTPSRDPCPPGQDLL